MSPESQEWCFIFANLRLGRMQPPFREEYFQIFALIATQSALLLGITNLAFQFFLLPAARLNSKLA
jgi:hypothetical protein